VANDVKMSTSTTNAIRTVAFANLATLGSGTVGSIYVNSPTLWRRYQGSWVATDPATTYMDWSIYFNYTSVTTTSVYSLITISATQIGGAPGSFGWCGEACVEKKIFDEWNAGKRELDADVYIRLGIESERQKQRAFSALERKAMNQEDELAVLRHMLKSNRAADMQDKHIGLSPSGWTDVDGKEAKCADGPCDLRCLTTDIEDLGFVLARATTKQLLARSEVQAATKK